jgi:hypothetical protein
LMYFVQLRIAPQNPKTPSNYKNILIWITNMESTVEKVETGEEVL